MLKAYKYRLLPTKEQAEFIDKHINYCRFVYNLALETKMYAWNAARKILSCYDLMKQLTDLKKNEGGWLNEVSSQSLESAIANMDSAFKSFFNGNGYPKFKSRRSTQSVTFRRDSSVMNSKIRLSKIGWIEFIKHRDLSIGEIRTVVVSKTPSGKYYVSILIKCNTELPDKKQIIDDTSVGVDVGIKSFAVLSDGISFDNPKYLQEQLTRLKKELRTLSRRYQAGKKISEQSKSWHKQKLVVSKLHEKIANKRKDFAHKISCEIIKRYDTVFIEDLNVSGMVKNRKLSRSISDAGWYQFMEFLKYKADWSGKNVIEINRFYPSSKTCSVCGTVKDDLKLDDREWTCGTCGTHHLRDHNAAININKIGLKNTKSK